MTSTTTTISIHEESSVIDDNQDVISLQDLGRQLSEHVDDEQPPAHAVPAVPDGGYGWVVVASCSFLLFLINGFNTSWGVFQTALLLNRPDLHTNIRTVTFIVGLNQALLSALGFTSVRLLRRFGTRVPCVVAVVFYGLSMILSSLTLDHIEGLFCTAGALVGVSTSLVFAATNNMPLDWFSSRLGTANGLVKAGGGLGATIMPIAAQAMINSFGIAWAFRTFGFFILATGIPCSLLLKDNAATRQAARFQWSYLKNPPFLALSLAGATYVFVSFVPPFFLPLFANSVGLSTTTGAALVAGFGASTTFGRLVSGWLCDHMGAFNTLAIAAFINSLTMWAIWPVSSSLGPLILFAIANGIANGSFFVAMSPAMAAITPGTAASAISLAGVFQTPGYLVGSPIAGMLIQATGAEKSSSIEPYRAAIFYSAGVALVATMLVIYSRVNLEKKLFKRL